MKIISHTFKKSVWCYRNVWFYQTTTQKSQGWRKYSQQNPGFCVANPCFLNILWDGVNSGHSCRQMITPWSWQKVSPPHVNHILFTMRKRLKKNVYANTHIECVCVYMDPSPCSGDGRVFEGCMLTSYPDFRNTILLPWVLEYRIVWHVYALPQFLNKSRLPVADQKKQTWQQEWTHRRNWVLSFSHESIKYNCKFRWEEASKCWPLFSQISELPWFVSAVNFTNTCSDQKQG